MPGSRPAARRARGEARPRRVEQHDQVDIRGVVELARAQLAHGQHHVAAGPLRRLRIGEFQLAALGRGAQQVAQRHGERAIGEVRERGGDPLERPMPGQVGQPDQQRRLPAPAAQAGHQRLAFGLAGKFALEPVQDFA